MYVCVTLQYNFKILSIESFIINNCQFKIDGKDFNCYMPKFYENLYKKNLYQNIYFQNAKKLYLLYCTHIHCSNYLQIKFKSFYKLNIKYMVFYNF